jgi:peptide/nickel transport system substrate-binding protein
LRDRVRWQDGEPITAQDIRFAYDVDVQSAVGSATRWIADRIESIDVVDELAVRVRYRAGERWDGYALAPRVLPRHILANADAAKRDAYLREPVHAGAFSVAAWVRGYGVTLAAFPGYVGGAPALGRLEVRFFPDRTAVLAALRNGDVDLAPSPALEADLARTLDRFGDTNRLDVLYRDIEAIDVLRFGRTGKFSEQLVRKAVELTIDRQAIVNDIFAGRARIPRSYLVPPLWAAAEVAPATRPDRDGARALLAQAGFRKGRFGILERDIERMTATLLVAVASPARIDVARRIAGDLASVGIAVDVRARPADEVASVIAKGDFDMALTSEDADDAAVATERWTGLVDPWFDVLALAARRAPGRDEKRPLYAELQRIWSDALPGLPIYQHLRVDVAARSLTGIQAPPRDAALTWNAAAWRFGVP